MQNQNWHPGWPGIGIQDVDLERMEKSPDTVTLEDFQSLQCEVAGGYELMDAATRKSLSDLAPKWPKRSRPADILRLVSLLRTQWRLLSAIAIETPDDREFADTADDDVLERLAHWLSIATDSLDEAVDFLANGDIREASWHLMAHEDAMGLARGAGDAVRLYWKKVFNAEIHKVSE